MKKYLFRAVGLFGLLVTILIILRIIISTFAYFINLF